MCVLLGSVGDKNEGGHCTLITWLAASSISWYAGFRHLPANYHCIRQAPVNSIFIWT